MMMARLRFYMIRHVSCREPREFLRSLQRARAHAIFSRQFTKQSVGATANVHDYGTLEPLRRLPELRTIPIPQSSSTLRLIARARARPREWLFEWSGRAITHAGHFSSVCAAAAQMVDRPWKFHAAGVNFSGRQMAGAERERERERCSRERERCPRAMPDENCSSRSSVQNA